MAIDQVAALLAAVSAWAESEPGILAAALCGSHARGRAGPDSDVDLIVVRARSEAMLADLAWVSRFGSVRALALEDYGLVRSVRVHYRHGTEVEFGITGAEWMSAPLDDGTAGVLRTGVRILWDPSAQLAHALEDSLRQP